MQRLESDIVEPPTMEPTSSLAVPTPQKKRKREGSKLRINIDQLKDSQVAAKADKLITE